MAVVAGPLLSVEFGEGVSLPVENLEVDPGEITYVRSLGAVLPDPRWVFVDGQGHDHRWSKTGRDWPGEPEALPTLRRRVEHVVCGDDCDLGDDCEGYDRTTWYCADCGEQVEPGTIPDAEARGRGIPLRTSAPTAKLTVQGNVPELFEQRDPVPVTIRRGDATLAGRAWCTGQVWRHSTSSGHQSTFTLDVALDDLGAPQAVALLGEVDAALLRSLHRVR